MSFLQARGTGCKRSSNVAKWLLCSFQTPACKSVTQHEGKVQGHLRRALFTRHTFRSIYYLKVPYWKHKLLCQCPFTVIGYSELWLQRQRENNITTCLVIPDQYKYMFIHPVQYCNSALFIIDQFD